MNRNRRKELTFSQATPFVLASLRRGHTPALLGEPAIGKSSLIQDLGRLTKSKVFTLAINQLGDVTDLTGVRMTQDPETGGWRQETFPHYTIAEAIKYADNYPKETPILFLDEFNRATKDITGAVLSLQTDRAIGTTKLPDNLKLIIAGNDEGNITALDEASVSRFALYKVRPDIETFMGLKELNPFVEQVLTTHPEDLVAHSIDQPSGSEDDDDDDSGAGLSSYEELMMQDGGGDGFKQITRPRTITYVSEWLDEMGIDMSGSDEEKDLLSNLLSDVTESGGDDDSVLLVAIEGYVGTTTFSENLYNSIRKHFHDLINKGTQVSKPLLESIRPEQDHINELSRVTNQQDVEVLIESMEDEQRMNMLVWLTEMVSTKEIDNNKAVSSFMSITPFELEDFNGNAIKNLMAVVTDATRSSNIAIEALIKSSAPMIVDKWKSIIESAYEKE